MMSRSASTRRRRGISLVELLIALAITAVLLGAVAIAFEASFTSYRENEEMADALQEARTLSHRILAQARRSSYLNVANSGTRIEIEMPDDDYQHIYVYAPDGHSVTLQRMNLDTLAVENLGTVEDVTGFTIPSGQWTVNPARLTLSMTIDVGGNEATISSSAVPRTTISF